MVTLLAKLFIRKRTPEEAADSQVVRRAYGVLCGAVGIALNILLFLGKLFAGSLSGSIAIMADAFNNLSDAGSSVITLIGFRMAGQKPDPEHPFGHGRIEYISGFIVAIAILLMGFELLTSSIEKIVSPEPVAFSGLTAANPYLACTHVRQGVRTLSMSSQSFAAVRSQLARLDLRVPAPGPASPRLPARAEPALTGV